MKEKIDWARLILNIGLFIAFIIGAYEGVMLLIQYTQNTAILGILFYLLYLAVFSLIVYIINFAYLYFFKKGKPLIGMMSLGLKHLTNEQASNMGSKALVYEVVLLRMDALIPSSLVFALLLFATLPSQITTISYTEAFLLVAILESTYVLSYMTYVGILAKMLGWKYNEEQFSIEKIQSMVNSSLISGVDAKK
jgi:hypothetical protein